MFCLDMVCVGKSTVDTLKFVSCPTFVTCLLRVIPHTIESFSSKEDLEPEFSNNASYAVKENSEYNSIFRCIRYKVS